MKLKNIIFTAIAGTALLFLLTGCGKTEKKFNTANLDLDIGIGISHFDDDSDYPAPSSKAYLDVYSSKIVISGAYDNKIIETPLINNNASTAHPRMQLTISGNRMYVVYCPDISLPTLQIASTNDGGDTWIQSTLALDVAEVGTIDKYIASFWSTRSGALIIANGMVNTYIYVTNDSGKTWTRTEGAPPEQNWHDSLYSASFLNDKIGFISYSYYSFPPNEPQTYITLDGGASWNLLPIKVPSSVMDSYALTGAPFYDGTKVNIPIELYNADGVLSNTVNYVSYDLCANWEYFVDDGGKAETIRNNTMLNWFEENRYDKLSAFDYKVVEFDKYNSFKLDEDVRIDAYRLITAYRIDDWSKVKLTKDMYFDDNAWLYYKEQQGWPILMFVCEGDVFNYTYSLLGVSYEEQYNSEGDGLLAKRLFEDYKLQAEQKKLFADACEAYAWFTGYTSPIYGEESITHNGDTYTSVNFKGGNTLDELRLYLSFIFDEKITSKLMNTKTSEGKPLFIEKEGKLYRFGGYVGLLAYDTVEYELTVSDPLGSTCTIGVKGKEDIEGEEIEFSYDCICVRQEDGTLRMKEFKLPIEHLYSIAAGAQDDNFKTERSIDSISNWADLNYSSKGSSQIYEYLEAFIYGNTAALSKLSIASDASVFADYPSNLISEYRIIKKYIGEQPSILFEYTIGENGNSYPTSPRLEPGKHSAYVTVCKNGIYLTDTVTASKTDAGKYLSDYFECMLEYMPLDFGDLNYQQNYDLTQFILRRLGGRATGEEISRYARTHFGIPSFSPSQDLAIDNEYVFAPIGMRKIKYDIVSETIFGDECTVLVKFYADLSGFVHARTVEYKLNLTNKEYSLDKATIITPSNYRVCRYSE